MPMSEGQLELRLKLSRLEYEVKPVRVMVVRDAGKMLIDGLELELRKGTEVEVPRWLARVLANKGVVELVESRIGLEDIARVHFSVYNARTPSETPELPTDFYWQVHDYIAELTERVRRELNPVLLDEKQKAVMFTAEIAGKRVTQILQVLRSTAAMVELSAKLSPEERALLDTMRELLEKWMKTIVPGETR